MAHYLINKGQPVLPNPWWDQRGPDVVVRLHLTPDRIDAGSARSEVHASLEASGRETIHLRALVDGDGLAENVGNMVGDLVETVLGRT